MENSYDGSKKPKTIEELKIWYEARKLPPEETTRFFIGKKIEEPRAFCIYKEDGIVTVYKNKNDGSRAVRYTGEDEEFAVSEFYERLKQEIKNQKFLSKNGPKAENAKKTKAKMNTLVSIIIAFFISIFTLGIVKGCKDAKKNGYYFYNNSVYYNNSGTWYIYEDSVGDYRRADVPDELDENYDNYKKDADVYEGTDYDFFDSETGQAIYEDEHSYDWDEDNDSWDSGGTDFDSDW